MRLQQTADPGVRPRPHHNDSMLVLGLGLAQIVQVSLLVRGLILLAKIEHFPAPEVLEVWV